MCCQVEVSETSWSLVQGVLQTVMRRCVWSRNLNNEAMARVGTQRHRGKEKKIRWFMKLPVRLPGLNKWDIKSLWPVLLHIRSVWSGLVHFEQFWTELLCHCKLCLCTSRGFYTPNPCARHYWQLRMEQRYFYRLLQAPLSILTAELCHGFKQSCGVLLYHWQSLCFRVPCAFFVTVHQC